MLWLILSSMTYRLQNTCQRTWSFVLRTYSLVIQKYQGANVMIDVIFNDLPYAEYLSVNMEFVLRIYSMSFPTLRMWSLTDSTLWRGMRCKLTASESWKGGIGMDTMDWDIILYTESTYAHGRQRVKFCSQRIQHKHHNLAYRLRAIVRGLTHRKHSDDQHKYL